MEFFIALVVLAGAAIIGYKILNREKADGSHPLDIITPAPAPVKEVVTEDGNVTVPVEQAVEQKSPEPVKPAPTAKAEVAAKRTRKNGKFVGDDKSTPDVNEAFKEGKAPAKARKPKTKKPKMTVVK